MSIFAVFMAVIVTALMLAYLRTEHHNAASHENQQDLKLQAGNDHDHRSR